MDIKKAVIEICGSCNYKCTFCPQSWDGGREKSFKKMMNFDLFTDALDQLMDTDVEEIYLEGSGEPTMNKRLPEYVKAGTDRGFKMSFITNGYWFKGDLMKATVDAGLHFARFSVTGYTPELYNQEMHNPFGDDAFYTVRENAENAIRYIADGPGTIGSYHLILDSDVDVQSQVKQYYDNFIQHIPGIRAGIWRMHNWSGQFEEVDWRMHASKKRSCGRPFSPDLIVRAGGNDGKEGAVVPCCMVLGQDSKAVMGHLSENTVEEIWNGEKYEWLRKMHREHRFDEVDFCKNCDMLYETPEALVWDNFGASYDGLTGGAFSMKEFRK